MLEITPRPQTLAGIPILRVLPFRKRRHVGPFVFLDHIGPHTFEAGHGMDILPHPHIGLSTITYVFDGSILHRDGLGTVQVLAPGEVNWMKTGWGLAHSERTPDALRPKGSTLHAVQAWMILPEAQREANPSFVHLDAAQLPTLQCGAAQLKLIGGQLEDKSLAVPESMSAFYAEVTCERLGKAQLPHPNAQAAFYLVTGAVQANGAIYDTPQLLVFDVDEAAELTFLKPTRGMWLGGAPLQASPVMWWNFVADSQARIDQAKADWQAGAFAVVPGEPDRMPLPDLPAPAPHPL